jgi:hypothetical protein
VRKKFLALAERRTVGRAITETIDAVQPSQLRKAGDKPSPKRKFLFCPVFIHAPLGFATGVRLGELVAAPRKLIRFRIYFTGTAI